MSKKKPSRPVVPRISQWSLVVPNTTVLAFDPSLASCGWVLLRSTTASITGVQLVMRGAISTSKYPDSMPGWAQKSNTLIHMFLRAEELRERVRALRCDVEDYLSSQHNGPRLFAIEAPPATSMGQMRSTLSPVLASGAILGSLSPWPLVSIPPNTARKRVFGRGDTPKCSIGQILDGFFNLDYPGQGHWDLSRTAGTWNEHVRDAAVVGLAALMMGADR